MSEVLGGSSTVTPNGVMGRIQGLKIPAFEGADQSAPEAPPQVAKPQPVMNPTPAVAEAEAPDTSVIDLPDFSVVEEAENPPTDSNLAPVEDDLEADLPDTPAAENFKKLRGVVKTERQLKRELEARLQETAERLERYEKGEIIPEVIEAKDRRIAELEPFEKIVSLRTSKEYQENYVEPAIKRRERLEKIGGDFRVPPEVMRELVELESERQLGDFISRNFDPVTGLEVKQIVRELQDLGAKAIEAEKQPESTLNQLRQQYAEKEHEEKKKRASVFESVAKEAWVKALQKAKEEGAYKELVPHPTDTEFNKRVVEPIQAKASQNFGALVKQLADLGLTNLPPQLAVGLARLNQLAVAGAMALDAKAKAEAERNAVLQNSKRTSGYMRPQIGGNNGAGHGSKAQSQQPLLNPRSAAELAAKVFNK